MIHPFEQTLNKMAEFGLFNDFEERQKDEFLLDIERKIQPETDYFQFIKEFNRITGKKYFGDIESRKLFYKYESVYSSEERLMAVTNANKNPYSKQNSAWLTPAFILVPDNLGQYLNYNPPGTNGQSNQPKTKVKDGDYSEVQDF
jgi:hypothetical protein